MEQRLQATVLTLAKVKIVAYWLTTAIIVLETGAGAEWDLVRNPYVSGVLHQLGYPLYVLSIIGFWKILAVVALLVPGFPRVKEWAYAGIFFVYSTAAISHFATGDSTHAWGPLFFAVIELASWALRPASRRLTPTKGDPSPVHEGARQRSKAPTIAYWTTLIMLEFTLLSAAATEVTHFSGNVEGIVHRLGYPLYFLTIQGLWKLLAGVALLLPRTPILKEWAYAGIFFSMTGAAASNAYSAQGAGHVLTPLFIAGLAVVSWALRPASKRLPG